MHGGRRRGAWTALLRRETETDERTTSELEINCSTGEFLVSVALSLSLGQRGLFVSCPLLVWYQQFPDIMNIFNVPYQASSEMCIPLSPSPTPLDSVFVVDFFVVVVQGNPLTTDHQPEQQQQRQQFGATDNDVGVSQEEIVIIYDNEQV